MTVASLTLSADASQEHGSLDAVSSDTIEHPPFIRRSEENMQLIVGEKPGEFELFAPQGPRFSFSTDAGVTDHSPGLMQDFVGPL